MRPLSVLFALIFHFTPLRGSIEDFYRGVINVSGFDLSKLSESAAASFLDSFLCRLVRGLATGCHDGTP